MSRARSLTKGEWFDPTKVSSILLKSNEGVENSAPMG
jgi:hypothetical protein